jgi:long-subunit acyl-CoA synthetase (AMP-forming)
MGVPRVWEKIEDGLRKAFQHSPRITGWARGVSGPGTDAEMKGKGTSISHKLSKMIVLRKIKKKLGNFQPLNY